MNYKPMEKLKQIDEILKNRMKRKNITDYALEMTLLKREKIYNRLLRMKRISYQRFTLNTAKVLEVSERTIQRHMRVANAIRRGLFSERLLHHYKKGQLKYTNMIEILKGDAEERVFLSQEALRAFENEKNLRPFNQIDHCRECAFGMPLVCPYCLNSVILCKRKAYPILKKSIAEACEDFQQ